MRRLLVSLGLVALFSFPALADDPPPAAPADPKPIGPEVHKVYVPYKDLQKVFEKEGQGVFVPYAEFRALWEKAYRMPDDPSRPPVAAAVRSAEYAGVAEKESIRFTAKLEVEVLAQGWQRLALDFGGVGIEQATIAGEPALLVPTEKGYDLLLQGQGRRTLDLIFRVGAPAQGDTHVAEFSLPPVPLARLSLRVPGTDTDVQVQPRLAGSTGPTADGATELLAYLGPVSKIKLTWRRRPDEGPKVDPLVFANETTDVLVDRGVVRTDFVANFSILRAPLDALTLVVPSDAVVLYVEGSGLRAWERNPAGDRITVTLREAVKDAWSLKVGLERALGALPAEVPLPLVGVEGLERETGFLRLRAAEGVKVDPRATPGLVQVDLSELPDPLKGAVAGKAFGWRHPGRPGAVTAAVEALASRVTALVGNRVGLKPESVDVKAVAVVTVERAGIFGVAFDLPTTLEVTEVLVQGAELDDWTRTAEGDGSVLRVAFRDRLLGTATVWVTGRQPLVLPDEEGKQTLFDVPLVRLRGAQNVRGYVALHADPALDRDEKSRAGLTTLEASTPSAVEPPAVSDGTLPLAARYEHRETAPALAFLLKRKAATVTGEVETSLRIESDRTRVLHVRLRYLVQFRGVETFRFRGPLNLDKRVHLGPGLAGMTLLDPEPEAKPDGAPDGWKAQRGTWTVRLSAPRQGVVEIPLMVDEKPEEPLTPGSSREVPVPVFVPMDADRKPLANTKHHAAVQRDPLLEVSAEKVEKGEEIDARELPPGLAAPETFLAFKSFDPEHAVTLRVTKHEYEAVAEVVVSHMHLNTVVPVAGKATTEAFLVVRNNDRQNLEVRLPPGAEIRSVLVDNKAETPRKGDDGTTRIPLPSGLGKDQAFVVAFDYHHDVERSGAFFERVSLVAPEPQRVKSDLLTWAVYVPKREVREVTAFGGSLVRADEGGSWALEMWRNVTGAEGLLKRTPDGQTMDYTKLTKDFEKSPFQLRLEGDRYLFTNRVGTGEVTLTSVNPTAFLLLKLALLVGAFVGARVLVRVARGLGHGRMTAFLVPALLLLVLLIPAGPGLAAVLTAMLVGVLVSGLVSFLSWVAQNRAERFVVAPPAPPASPPGSGPAAATGGAA